MTARTFDNNPVSKMNDAEGWLVDGIEAGTRWEDVPEDWTCPDCGAPKAGFMMEEIYG